MAGKRRDVVERATAVALAGLVGGTLAGCETNDPCALRQAACIDVVLIGNHDDGRGNPIAYRDLSVKVCAENSNSAAWNPSAQCNPPTADPNNKCDPKAACGEVLASSPMPLTLTAVAPYSANVQGLVTFKLPDSFNDRPDTPVAPLLDSCADTTAKINRLKELRGMDPRAIRIQITQAGETTPVWDSRCDEDLFSADQWTMLTYYRVGKNEYRGVYAPLTGAKTSPP